MKKKELAKEIVARLKTAYPVAICSLDYDEAWKLLVSVRLSAQCTDARVNIVTATLFEKYPTLQSLSKASVNEITDIVRPCGLGPSKARDIHACMNELLDRFDGKVPDTMEELLSLPGVGRKSANLILGDIYGKPAIVTDTHCIRITNRMGLVTGTKEPKKVEDQLWKIIPLDESNDFCHRLVLFGREVCTARSPKCDNCCCSDICKKKL